MPFCRKGGPDTFSEAALVALGRDDLQVLEPAVVSKSQPGDRHKEKDKITANSDSWSSSVRGGTGTGTPEQAPRALTLRAASQLTGRGSAGSQLSNPSLGSIQRQKLPVRGSSGFGITGTYPTGSLEAVKIGSEKAFPG